MFVAIDIGRVLEKVYALSALRAIDEGSAGIRETLGEDHERALRQIAPGAMAEITARLGSMVRETNLAEIADDSPALTMSIETAAESPAGLRLLIEEALALMIMARATAGSAAEAAAAMNEKAAALTAKAKDMAAGAGTGATAKPLIKEWY